MSAVHERGEVFWTALDPARGREQARTRPCVIVSDSAINRRRGTVIVVPLTTTVQEAMPPLLVAVPSIGPGAKARTEHLRAVDKSRLGRRLGRLSDEDMHALEHAIAKVLALS